MKGNQYLLFVAMIFLAMNIVPAYASDTLPTISNYKFGLICGTPDNRRVCFQTAVIQVTNESRCVYNYEEIPCTWYGFSFDYDAPADTRLSCEDTLDAPVANGNPTEIIAPSLSSFRYEIPLAKGSHHFFIAKYIRGERTASSPHGGRTECEMGDVTLFSTVTTFDFADEVEPVASVPDLNKKK